MHGRRRGSPLRLPEAQRFLEARGDATTCPGTDVAARRAEQRRAAAVVGDGQLQLRRLCVLATIGGEEISKLLVVDLDQLDLNVKVHAADGKCVRLPLELPRSSLGQIHHSVRFPAPGGAVCEDAHSLTLAGGRELFAHSCEHIVVGGVRVEHLVEQVSAGLQEAVATCRIGTEALHGGGSLGQTRHEAGCDAIALDTDAACGAAPCLRGIRGRPGADVNGAVLVAAGGRLLRDGCAGLCQHLQLVAAPQS
mmetsp:Transcript_118892/g.343896  ORF Transcript_118892/g.343896 Transcript_118892/m.343896 type:complete len:251 (+) Transcript_118892:1763-2515(+)